MASPLSIFRKHQVALMVGLVFVALGSFVIAPSIDEYLRSRSRVGEATDEVVVTWDGGRFRQSDLERMRQAHNLAVFYLAEVVRETLGRDGTPSGKGVTRSAFGQIVDPGIPAVDSDENLVYTALMARKADSMGMLVSDEAIIEFLEQLSDGVIPQREFRAIFEQALGNRVTERYVLDQLKTELLAQRMRATMASGLFIPPSGALTPGRAWRYFQRLNRNVQAELISLPVEDFFDQVGEPESDAVLRTLYEEGKEQFPDPERAEPGFKRRRQAAFQFARADFNKFLEAEKAKTLEQIGDEEIEAHYEENKQKYALPATTDPEAGEPETGEPETDEPRETETDGSTSVVPEDAQPDATRPDANAGPVESRGNPAGEAREADSSDDAPESDQQGGGPREINEYFVSVAGRIEEGGEAEQESPEPSSTEDESQGGEPATSSEDTGATEDPSPNEGSADAVAEEDTDSAATDTMPEEVRYRPLDDALRAEIRAELSDIQARKPAQDRLDAALEAIERQIDAHERTLRRAEFQADTEPPGPLGLGDLEKDELVELGELPLVDSLSVRDYEIGSAFETEFVTWPPRRIQFDVVAFRGGMSLYTPSQISGADTGITFVYWKTEDEEPYVPEFADVRDDVLTVWKRQRALDVARREAERLADEARSRDGTPMGEVFSERDDLKPVTTDLFSWMSTGFNPAGLGAPGISNVEGVKGVGPAFMEAVFSLGKDEVGIAVNEPRDVVYVVRIVLESPTEEILRERFLQSGVTFEVASIADTANVDLRTDWYEDLETELDVQWNRSAMTNSP